MGDILPFRSYKDAGDGVELGERWKSSLPSPRYLLREMIVIPLSSI
jgi:hypothetical protein